MRAHLQNICALERAAGVETHLGIFDTRARGGRPEHPPEQEDRREGEPGCFVSYRHQAPFSYKKMTKAAGAYHHAVGPLSHLWFRNHILQSQQGRVLGPPKGADVVANLGPLCLRQTEHEQTLDQALSPCKQEPVTPREAKKNAGRTILNRENHDVARLWPSSTAAVVECENSCSWEG